MVLQSWKSFWSITSEKSSSSHHWNNRLWIKKVRKSYFKQHEWSWIEIFWNRDHIFRKNYFNIRNSKAKLIKRRKESDNSWQADLIQQRNSRKRISPYESKIQSGRNSYIKWNAYVKCSKSSNSCKFWSIRILRAR